MAIIDPSWVPVEGQEGLYVEIYERVNSLTGAIMVRRILHSADGYCFYDNTEVIFDEEGNEVPENEVTPEMRTYYQYMSIVESTDITNFVSVPVDPAYEIVNAPINTETI